MNKRFLALDAFRGIAAICIVVFHMHLVGAITELGFFRGSDLFVEFFFVLSGFVLAHAYGFKNVSFKRFFISRTFRLYPLHLFMFFLFVPLELGKLFAFKAGIVFNTAPFTELKALDEILPNLLFLQSWLPMYEAYSWNYPSWSLSVEYYMYMLFFLTLFIKHPIKYVVWFIISVVSFFLLMNKLGLKEEALRGLSCFFAGSLAYLLYKNISNKLDSLGAIFFNIAEIALLIIIFFVISYVQELKGVIASFVFVITVFIFAFERGFFGKLLTKSIFQAFGRLSYSIYMTHVAILFCVTSIPIVLAKITGSNIAPMIEDIRYLDFGSSIANNLFIGITVLTVIGCSALTYKYIEVKGQELGRKLLKK
ncbi:acyltransferase family protein [Candidatus Nitrosacidococcus tergens]|uniref:O-acetyltransferase n=1 Tax=Candidatus Nitrosacidococcus tergens TaxID=553981 RepID=A0A7G1QAD6_9GAMM|nr:acyltransferase [Candidatus Nitrosacidococcus tergens]CAB1276370.1 O-acetyltransferase [Candidatus Nitrosacidococcus tergens]